jgi:RNA polymerase sigma factor (sigma-70 family)
MEIAVESPERFPTGTEETSRPIEAAVKKHREFDYDGLVRPMESRMMRSIWRIVRHRETAEDALQDALAVIWRKRGKVARHPHPQALILRISIGAAYDALRKNRRRLRYEVPGLPEQPTDDSAVPVTKESEDRSLRSDILAAIGRLPKRQAMAVLLRIVEEQSYEEIARGMGCSETTVRIHVMRARAALSRQLACLRQNLPGKHQVTKKEAVS